MRIKNKEIRQRRHRKDAVQNLAKKNKTFQEINIRGGSPVEVSESIEHTLSEEPVKKSTKKSAPKAKAKAEAAAKSEAPAKKAPKAKKEAPQEEPAEG